jgi:hypothetical protein
MSGEKNSGKDDGRDALRKAAAAGDTSGVERLLAAGTPPTAATDGGFTPLIAAVDAGHTVVVRRLLAARADPTATTLVKSIGLTVFPLLIAAQRTDAEILRLLLDAGGDAAQTLVGGGGHTALAMAAARGGAAGSACVRLLLDRGAVVDAADYEGDTALLEATRGGHVQCVRLLIAGGGDARKRNGAGVSPRDECVKAAVDTAATSTTATTATATASTKTDAGTSSDDGDTAKGVDKDGDDVDGVINIGSMEMAVALGRACGECGANGGGVDTDTGGDDGDDADVGDDCVEDTPDEVDANEEVIVDGNPFDDVNENEDTDVAVSESDAPKRCDVKESISSSPLITGSGGGGGGGGRGGALLVLR